MAKKSFKRQNNRRLDLIDKKYSGEISDVEKTELASLQKWVGDYMAEKFPRDTTVLDEMMARLDELKRKKIR